MSVLYGVTLLVKGETKKTKLKETKDKSPLSLDSIQAILKKKTDVQELGTYECQELRLTLFGYTTGKAGTENKHDLPPPLNEVEYFGDILLIAWREGSSWQTPVNFTTDDYEKFYQTAFNGGYEDDEDEDDDEQEEEEVEVEEVEDVEDVEPVKKKKCKEDGEPEDEVDVEEEEEEEEEEECDVVEEEDTVTDDVEIIDEGEEEHVVPTRKPAAKKKPTKSSAVNQNTGRARQYQLKKKIGFQELESTRPIPIQEGSERMYRLHATSLISKHLGTYLSKEDITRLEVAILQITMSDANAKMILRNFDNPLFRDMYMCVIRRILSNLNPNSYVGDTGLLPKLLSKDLTIETLATMHVTDYSPHLYAGLRERMLLREKQQLEGNKAMATDMFKCGRCHKRETTFYELQTRSADEPMTKFITCVNCGNHWRM